LDVMVWFWYRYTSGNDSSLIRTSYRRKVLNVSLNCRRVPFDQFLVTMKLRMWKQFSADGFQVSSCAKFGDAEG
jgi:hypothetical protein